MQIRCKAGSLKDQDPISKISKINFASWIKGFCRHLSHLLFFFRGSGSENCYFLNYFFWKSVMSLIFCLGFGPQPFPLTAAREPFFHFQNSIDGCIGRYIQYIFIYVYAHAILTCDMYTYIYIYIQTHARTHCSPGDEMTWGTTDSASCTGHGGQHPKGDVPEIRMNLWWFYMVLLSTNNHQKGFNALISRYQLHLRSGNLKLPWPIQQHMGKAQSVTVFHWDLWKLAWMRMTAVVECGSVVKQQPQKNMVSTSRNSAIDSYPSFAIYLSVFLFFFNP